ncbi:MAG: hypothetical protein AB7Q37_09325 [Pyrinomonadaceae bacterium]
MKKLIYLAMMFGLLMVFSGSVSAQKVRLVLSFDMGGSGLKAAAGDGLRLDIHTRLNSEPGAPKGTKYLTLKFLRRGKQYSGGLSLSLTPEQIKALGTNFFENLSITKVENPLPIRERDRLIVTLYEGASFIQAEGIRNKKTLGKMKIHLRPR